MSEFVVIYHANCIDGFTAAWAARQHFKKTGLQNDVKYIPAKYGSEPPWDAIQDALVYVVDFSYPRDKLLEMKDAAEGLLVLDHHKTAREDLKGLEFAQFDMERSGAGMAWDHFMEENRPWLVNYVEDRDLWRWSLPNSREINAYISSQQQTFENWDHLNSMNFATVLSHGKVVCAYIDKYVGAMSEQARIMEVHDHAVPVVNAPYLCISELLNELAKTAEFAVGWSQMEDGSYVYSLRSCDRFRLDEGLQDRAFDVSELARKHGGGGHHRSAGFRSRLPPDIEFMTDEQRAEMGRRVMRFLAT